MVNTSSLAALAILSAPASAFVPVGRRAPPSSCSSALHATEAFQRSLLAERFGTKASSTSVAPAVASVVDEEAKAMEQEMFHRSLLEAKLAFDAIDSTLGTPKVAEETVAVVEEPMAIAEETEVVVASEPEPVAVPKPEPIVAEIPKSVIPTTPRVEPPKAKRATQFTVPREFAIVPINESTVQFTAGALGAAAGYLVGGPVLGAIAGSIFNYLSRKDGYDDDLESAPTGSAASAKKLVDTASQTALLAYNFVANFEKQNRIVDSTFNLMETAVDKVKEMDSPAGDVLVTVESTLGGIANKVEELNDDYDLVGGAGTVLGSVGDLVEIGLDKVVELNGEYRLTDRVGGVVSGAVDKVQGLDKVTEK